MTQNKGGMINDGWTRDKQKPRQLGGVLEIDENLNRQVINCGNWIVQRWIFHWWARSHGTFWFVDLHVDASVVLGPHNFEEGANSASGLALATNDVTHIGWIDVKRNQYAHLINRAIGFDVLGVCHERLYKILNERLIHLLFGHTFSAAGGL
jgi:hypothetical protein